MKNNVKIIALGLSLLLGVTGCSNGKIELSKNTLRRGDTKVTEENLKKVKDGLYNGTDYSVYVRPDTLLSFSDGFTSFEISKFKLNDKKLTFNVSILADKYSLDKVIFPDITFIGKKSNLAVQKVETGEFAMKKGTYVENSYSVDLAELKGEIHIVTINSTFKFKYNFEGGEK